jgi:hypothetical protein
MVPQWHMLIWFGAGSQFVGLLLLFAGFVTTWHSYGDGRNFLVFVADRARQWIARRLGRIRQRMAIGQRLSRVRQRLRKKDSEPVTGTASGEYSYTGAALNATGTFTAEAEVWPSVVDDPDRFAKAVRDRFGELANAGAGARTG